MSEKMREILFRGKTKHGKWVHGWFCGKTLNHMMDGTEECSQIIHSDTLYWHVVKTQTVGQFTGLTDKNGKKIFANDIIVICYETDGEEFSETKKVRYNEKECCWYPMRWEECCEHCDHYTEVKSIEVIGNIHDNPELLKRK